jgi:hypothetical protein
MNDPDLYPEDLSEDSSESEEGAAEEGSET